MIVEKLKSELLRARKEKNSSQISFYSTLLGEVENIGKSAGNRVTTDDEAVRHIKKWVANIEETIRLRGEGVATALLQEKVLCEQFLPAMLSVEELRGIISKLVAEGKNQGEVMKHLKEVHPNKYDGKLASNIYKEIANA